MVDAGISGAWATAVFYVIPTIIILPIVVWRWRQLLFGGWYLHAIGFMAALALVTYAAAIGYTDVIRAMLLYYLTPLWSTLLARAVLGERITIARSFAMILGLFGALVIFRFDVGIPLPQNVGDWLGLISGIAWAIAAVLMHCDKKGSAIDYTLSYFVWGAVIAVFIALLPISGIEEVPDLQVVLPQLIWLVPVIVIIVMPGVFTAFWGTQKLSPGLAGLLFMTEITVGTITAALWSGDDFGIREIIGILLISAAALVESVVELLKRRQDKLAEV